MVELGIHKTSAMAQICVRATIALLLTLYGAAAAPQSQGGELHLVPIESQIFGNTRMLRVWLPTETSEHARQGDQYPVLYLNDGQDLFDAETALLGQEEWQVDETVTRLTRNGSIPPLIVVGIDNAGKRQRPIEYLVYPDKYLSPPVAEPQGRHYARFLREEVIPLVEARFAVRPGFENRILGGSSYGALIALDVAIREPALFSALLLESPSLYVDEQHVLADLKRQAVRIERVYVGVGTNELAASNCEQNPGNVSAVTDVLEMAELLKRKGVGEHQILVNVENCARHSQAAWARRLPAALEFLYGTTN